MCEMCLADAEYVGEVVPGWYLSVARQDGGGMRTGDYGLTRCNGPEIIIPAALRPIADPLFGLSDEQVDILSDEEFEQKNYPFTSRMVEIVKECLWLQPSAGHELFEACVQAGFDYSQGGMEAFLVHKMGETIALFEAGWDPLLKKWKSNVAP